jgi:hypothetical protein
MEEGTSAWYAKKPPHSLLLIWPELNHCPYSFEEVQEVLVSGLDLKLPLRTGDIVQLPHKAFMNFKQNHVCKVLVTVALHSESPQ